MKLDFHFPNLTHLKMDASTAYQIEDSLSMTNLPKLTHLSISSSTNISEMIENYHTPHAGITSLHVAGTFNPEDGNYAVVKLVNLFPAVTEFKLNVAIEFIEYAYSGEYIGRKDVQTQNILPLKETLQSLGGWELTCGGDVEVKFEYVVRGYSFEELDAVGTAVLQGAAEWKGLGNTCLKFVVTWVGETYKLLDGMRDALLSCGSIRRVTWEGFEMDEQDSIELNSFIGENNVPVSVPDPGWLNDLWTD
ncbi:uncharacterized protein LOC118437167 [Folsomia candida]|uniref:uncharacterized protein LOC118437167 n=1 Tax=Folsomia candida TaxID=158441 RepID=UPI001604C50C|nr:uncharacterized protein LOC118437167 [Folsomia candida]